MSWIGAVALAVLLLPAAAEAEVPADCGPPAAELGDGWTVAAPQREGLDPSLICSIGPMLARLRGADAHGVVVARNGVLVYEAYFRGPDGRWPEQHWGERLVETPHDVRSLHDLQSITKSVVAILVGAALERGAIPSLDTPVLSFFPDYSDLRTPERERITVRDLLTMTTGLRWIYEPYLAMARRMDAAPDPFRFVLQQPMTGEPGRDFRYNNGTVELVGGVLARATHEPLDEFAKETLFEPLGIRDWQWGRMANGDPGASWGLRLRPRDLAKIGQLVLNRGLWQGHRIVSADWISAMTTRQVDRNDTAYGYLWWLDRRQFDGRLLDVAVGSGWGGQCLFVVPDLGLVVVATAGLYDLTGSGDQNRGAETAFDQVLRAVRSPPPPRAEGNPR